MSSPDRNIPSSHDDIASAEQALRQRPQLSIRMRVALGFMVPFLLFCILTVSAVVFISRLGAKQLFIEKAGNYAFEIQQARRFEKNFLLYGTDLYDALSHVTNARNILIDDRVDLCAVIGEKAYRRMVNDLNRYHELLENLDSLSKGTDSRKQSEADLRSSGSELVADAASSIDKERLSFHSWLHSARIFAASALVIILLLEGYIVTFIARQIFLPFKRFEGYMRRIADGDFSPVTPVKKYQDEFTDLAIAINRMLSEIQDRENQLVETRKMAAIGTLTAGIAHEINNPLNNISLTSEALLDEFDTYSDSEKLDMLKDIFSQVERASATVANLLDFTHRDESAFRAIDICEVLKSTASLLDNELLLGNVVIKMDLAENLPAINGHFQNLQQVFVNIVLNAKEAMPLGGELTIRSYLQGNWVCIDISDTGEGIPEKSISRIFEPFYTTKAVGKGTGLGLSVSFGIIEKHHGSISVRSEENIGSTFTIRLPPASEAI